jgi:hypothetical protein
MKSVRFLVLILAGALAGCAAIERQQTADTEKLLAGAGFQRRALAGAGQNQDFAGVPPLEVVARQEGANTVYVYADPQSCRCVYVGGPEAYGEYRELALSEAIAQDMSEVALNPVFMRTGTWGARYPRPAPIEDD